MPIYEYECKVHGTFEQTCPVNEYRSPASCPYCQLSCARIVSAPHLAILAPAVRIAHDRNARSRSEPQVRHGGAHCGHEHHVQEKKPPRAGLTAYNGPRPWVIEHG